MASLARLFVGRHTSPDFDDSVYGLYDQAGDFKAGVYDGFFATPDAKEEFRMSLALGLTGLHATAKQIAECAPERIGSAEVSLWFAHGAALEAVLGEDYKRCSECKMRYLPETEMDEDCFPRIVEKDDEAFNGALADRRVLVGGHTHRGRWVDGLVRAVCSTCFHAFEPLYEEDFDEAPNGELTDEDDAEYTEWLNDVYDRAPEGDDVEDAEDAEPEGDAEPDWKFV